MTGRFWIRCITATYHLQRLVRDVPTCFLRYYMFQSVIIKCLFLANAGLGDFVPATSANTSFRQQIYRLGTIVYLYLGLTMMMLFLALIYRIPQFSFNKLLLSIEKEEERSDERAR